MFDESTVSMVKSRSDSRKSKLNYFRGAYYEQYLYFILKYFCIWHSFGDAGVQLYSKNAF